MMPELVLCFHFFFRKKPTFSWGKISDLSHSTDPIHAMNGLKRDFPFINHIFRKYCVIPATQNVDERLFYMVARITGPPFRSYKISAIEPMLKSLLSLCTRPCCLYNKCLSFHFISTIEKRRCGQSWFPLSFRWCKYVKQH